MPPRAEAPHLEPSEVELREGVPTRVELVSGDRRLPMALTLKGDGTVEMSVLAEDQAWFWTDEWFTGELEAEEDIRSGRTTPLAEDEFLKVIRDY